MLYMAAAATGSSVPKETIGTAQPDFALPTARANKQLNSAASLASARLPGEPGSHCSTLAIGLPDRCAFRQN